jgi:hypothetical protein
MDSHIFFKMVYSCVIYSFLERFEYAFDTATTKIKHLLESLKNDTYSTIEKRLDPSNFTNNEDYPEINKRYLQGITHLKRKDFVYQILHALFKKKKTAHQNVDHDLGANRKIPLLFWISRR